MSERPAPGPTAARRVPLHKNPWVWAFIVGITTITLMRPLMRREPAPPQVLAQLPRFELVDAHGDRFGSADLADHVWVVGFFSAAGGTPLCQGLIDSMAGLGRRYAGDGIADVRLLGVSSDPGRDTPATIRAFGEAHDLDADRWTLATGELDQVRRVADELARATGGPPATATEAGRVSHPCELFLLDGSGGVRGSYRDDSKGLDEIFHRSRHVLRASR